MPDSAFNLKGTLLCDVKIDGQPVVGEMQENIGSYENMRSLNEATTDTADSLKQNAALQKEFGDMLPEMIKNFRYLSQTAATLGQSLPAIKRTLTTEERKREQLGDYSRQGLVQLANTGSNAVQAISNGSVSGVILNGVNGLSNTANNLSRIANVEEMAGLAKGLVAGGAVAAIAGAVIKGGDALATKFVEEMPTIYGTGRAFGSLSDEDSMLAYKRLNKYNKGTGLDIDTFQGLAQSLRKQGVGNGLSFDEQLSLAGNIAQTTSRWAYATGGDANQYANLAGLMSRYGGSKNVADDFNKIVSAGYASGLNDTQIPEFLSGIQKVMEDGIAKGFTRSATEVADTLLMFSKMSGNNAFWQGEQGAKLLNQANSGIANATNLAKTEDILVYQAFSNVYKNEGAIKAGIKQRNGSYIQGAEYSNMMQLIEGGITGENWNSLYDIISNSYGSEDEKIEALRSMTGLNYTGAARLWGLGRNANNQELESVLESPENKNKETRYQDAVNEIKEAVVKFGEGAAGVKIAGMEVVSRDVTRIANFLTGDKDTKNAEQEFANIYNGLSTTQKQQLNEMIPTFATVDERLAYAQWFVNDGIGMIPGVNKSNIYSDYDSGKLKSSVRWGTGSLLSPRDITEMPEYINQTYGDDILSLVGGNKTKAKALMKALESSTQFTNKVVEETKDSKVTEEERKATKALLEKIVAKMDEGFTMTQMNNMDL